MSVVNRREHRKAGMMAPLGDKGSLGQDGIEEMARRVARSGKHGEVLGGRGDNGDGGR